MAPTPVHSEQMIIAAGYTIRGRGEEPTRASLYRELGHQGASKRMWDVWTTHLTHAPFSTAAAQVPGTSVASPGLMRMRQSSLSAFDMYVAQAVREACAPLEATIEALRQSLAAINAESKGQEEVIEELQSVVTELRAELDARRLPCLRVIKSS